MDTNKAPLVDEEVQQDVLAKVKAHKSKLVWASVIVAALCAACLIWYFVAMSGAKKADEMVALADTEVNDSIALAYYQQAAQMGYKSGNRAGINAGIILYRQGKYQEAIDNLSDASSKSSIIEAGRLALIGDCYVNLNDMDKALASFKKAYDAADNNPQIAPFILVKQANIYRQQGHFEDEYKCYTTIKNEYPDYLQSLSERRTDLRKYIERSKVQAGK